MTYPYLLCLKKQKTMISENIKHISYNVLKRELKVYYTNGDIKTFNISENEYHNMVLNGDFNKIK